MDSEVFEVGKKVKVRKTGQLGVIKLLVGIPYRIVWVDLIPGADGHYQYIRLYTKNGIETETLNPFKVGDLEILE